MNLFWSFSPRPKITVAEDVWMSRSDPKVLCIFASLGFHSRSFRGVNRMERKNFIHHQQASELVKSKLFFS